MIITIENLIDIIDEATDHKLSFKELLCEYHLRFEDGSISCPVNHIEVDTATKAITMKYKKENVRKEMKSTLILDLLKDLEKNKEKELLK